MTLLFDRKIRVQMGNVIVEALRIEFNVKKSLNVQSNKCDIKVFNLNEQSRAAINEKDGLLLFAGYFNPPLIFKGFVDRVIHMDQSPNRVTHIRGVDGLLAMTDPGKPLSVTGSTVVDIIRKLIPLTGVGPGNFEDFVHGRDPKKLTKFAATKSPYDSIVQLTSSLNADVTIQDGDFLFLAHGESISQDLAVLSANTGLIGSPDIGKKGVTKARCFIQRNLTPGYQVRIESLAVPDKPVFRIESVDFRGDTHGPEWSAHLELTQANATTGEVPAGD